MPLPRDPIDSAEAARLLEITIDNLHQRVHRGLVPAERIGRSLVFDRKVITRMAASDAEITAAAELSNKVMHVLRGRPKAKKK